MFYTGVVEDRQDPKRLGRCRVRVVGIHSEDRVSLKTEDLPWAWPMVPITSASMNGIGDAPVGPVEGSWVVIVFRDPDEFQQPMMMGTLGGWPKEASTGLPFTDPNKKYPLSDFLDEPDTNRLARNDSKLSETVVKTKEDARITDIEIGNSDAVWNQPFIPYNAKYPFNHVFQSESGNIREFDDTDKVERIHTYHRSGTFEEIDANGTRVNRIVGNNYEIVDNDGYIHIQGQCVVNVAGSATIRVDGDSHLSVGGKINIKADDNINIGSDKKITFQSGSDIQLSCKRLLVESESVGVNTKGKLDFLAGDTINFHGAKFYAQSNTANPPSIDYSTWNKFDASTLSAIPDAPSRTTDILVTVESYTPTQIAAVGLNPADPMFAKPTGTPVLQRMPPGTNGITPKPPVDVPNCDFSSDYQISTNFKVKQILFPQSGGKIVGQHGLTACQIMTNLTKVFDSIVEPIFANTGSNMVLTSAYRRAGNPHSMGNGKISRHEIGCAVDMQFRDCKTHDDYVARAKQIQGWCAYDQLIVENSGGKIWLHIHFNK